MSEDRIINVALVGGGEIAMCTHLPVFTLLSHLYRVQAIVDVSKQALEFCAQKFHIPRTFPNVTDMLAGCPDVDLAVICHSDEFHSVHAIQCLKAGKNVFIEKPMAQTIQEADDIEAARIASGKLVFVGYMRRFATAFLRVKEMVKELDPADINYVRIRNFTSRVNNGIISQSGTFSKRFNDYPAGIYEIQQKKARDQYEELTGLDYDSPVSQYLRGCKFHISPHDLGMMREIFGLPLHVISAVPNKRGNFITVMFQYDGFVLALEVCVVVAYLKEAYKQSGQDEVLSVDATMEICSQRKRIKLTFNSPYIKGLPITATVLSRHHNGDFSEEIIRPTYEDYYTLMFKELHTCLAGGKAVKTTVIDSREEIVLLADILRNMAQSYGKRQNGHA